MLKFHKLSIRNVVHIFVAFASLQILNGNDIFFEIVEPETLRYTFRSREAQDFGTSFNASLANVGLVVAEPSDGCSSLNQLELRNNVALVQRGCAPSNELSQSVGCPLHSFRGCSFLSKCIQAEMCGVLAVMIADSDATNDDLLIDMVDDNTKRNCSIPAVFLLGKDGHMIRQSLRTHGLMRAIINIPVNVSTVPLHRQRQPPWLLW